MLIIPGTDGVNHTHMVYQEVWPNAAVGQQEREGWVGAEQKGEDSGADLSTNTCTWSLGSHSATQRSLFTDSLDPHLDHITDDTNTGLNF